MIATVMSEVVVTVYQLWIIRSEINSVRLFDGFYKYVIAGICMFGVVFYLDNHLVSSYLHMALEIVVGAGLFGAIFVFEAVKRGHKNFEFGKGTRTRPSLLVNILKHGTKLRETQKCCKRFFYWCRHMLANVI